MPDKIHTGRRALKKGLRHLQKKTVVWDGDIAFGSLRRPGKSARRGAICSDGECGRQVHWQEARTAVPMPTRVPRYRFTHGAEEDAVGKRRGGRRSDPVAGQVDHVGAHRCCSLRTVAARNGTVRRAGR